VFDADGAPLYEWGIHALRPREGEGKLHYPSGIAVDAAGALAVVCEGFSDRVQLFGAATGPPELYMTDPAILPQGPARHYGMAIDSGGDLLFVAEPETETVLVFVLVDPVPVLIGRLGGYGAAADDLVEVVDVAASADGRECAITDVGSRRLSTFRLDRAQGEAPRFDPTLGWFVRSADLERVRERRFPAFDGPLEPGALERAEDGRLYVVDELRARILRFSPSFELELAFGGRVRGPGELRGPTDLLLTASDSELYVVDAPSRRVVVFDRSGRFLRALEGGLERPHGVALGPDGTAYVTDAGAHRVVVFGADGEVRATFGREGLGAGEFFKPRGIVVDGRGRVIVLDHGNHRGQIFTPEGEFLAAFGSRLYVKEARATR
jgi:DNA-binding beta-propeller fold protein YncE